jgi:D-glycero-alpha-D-manno-heptose-7-phosphate kinase
VLITRTPLRVSLGGGGTDLPGYYRRSGAMVVAAAITRHVYIGVNRTFTPDYFLKYSELERVRDVADIRHPIIREALTMHEVGPSLEIVSMADIPAGTGLGSSGTFTVGLLRALHALEHDHVTAAALAEEACHVELDRLRRPVGKQDQYIAAFGGLACLEFCPDDRVVVSPLRVSNATLTDLEERLLLFFTGYSRGAEVVLGRQRSRLERGDGAVTADLDEVARIGIGVRDALERGDTCGFAALMNEHWELKRRRELGISTSAIDRWCSAGRANGALGGKLVGAGGGGFLLFYAEDPPRLRAAMAREGLAELRFAFDHDGSTVIVRD